MSIPYAKVIVNPAAGASSTGRKWPRIERLLRDIGLSFDYQYTERVGHGIELARAAASEGYGCVVAVGGDGTVNEVANGILLSTGASNTALGVISTGTASDFARSAGIPRHYVSACSALTGSRRLLVDVGVMEYMSEGQSLRRYFVNSAGIGFDAAGCVTTERLPKYFGGTFPYLVGIFRTLFGWRNIPVVLRIGEKVEEACIFSVVVCNGFAFGGGMKMAPEASLTDSLLDAVVIGDVGKLEVLWTLPKAYKGTHVTHPKISVEKTANITVEPSERLLVHADGEVVGEGPVSFWPEPAALSVVV